MRRITFCFAVLLVISTAFAACGDDDATSPTTSAAPPSSATETTGAVVTTEAVTTTEAAATTEAATTTEAPTTTTTTEALPEHPHPIYGLFWTDVWPLADGSTAVYEVTNGGDVFDLPARYDHGVEFKDDFWDQFTLGVVQPNNEGVAMYIRSSEPWVVEFGGWEYYRPDGGYTLEWYPEPIRFDLTGDMLEPIATETVARLEVGGGVDDFGAIFTYYISEIDQQIEVPLGTLAGVRFQVDVSGELMGGGFVFPVELAFAEGHWLVEMINTPAHDRIALKEAWTG